MDFAAAAAEVLSSLLALFAVTPLVLVGMRNESRPNRLRLLGLSVLVWMSVYVAHSANRIFSIRQPYGFHWNWVGTMSSIAVTVLLLTILPADTLQKSGIFRFPKRNAALPILIMAVVCALPSGAAGLAGAAKDVSVETLAYQSIMPSLVEEPVCRGILPALLAGALGSPWKLLGARLGWWWLVCALLFGAGHGLFWTPHGPEIHWAAVVVTGIVGLLFGWLAARCESVWPCVMCHSLINATDVAVAMLSA